MRTRTTTALAATALLAAGSLALSQDKPDRPADADPDVVRTRSQLAKLRASLEEIRGEKLEAEIAVKSVDEAALTKESKVELDKRYDTRSDQIARAYERIGLFPKDYKLRAFMASTASQVLAYYEPAEHAFYIVRHDPPLETTDSTAIHELHHALQDQRFDLVAYYHFSNDPDPIAANDDAFLARKLVVEGEASYVGATFDAKKEGYLERLDAILEKRASMTRQELSRLERKQAARMEGGKGLLKAVNAEDSLPNYLYHELLDPYIKGPAIISRLKKQGGWKAVDELFTKPPASTKEVLHPDKLHCKLDTVEVPDLSLAIGSGYKRTVENTIGEVGVACVLEARALSKKLPEAAAKVAAGWMGDRFQAYENPARETCAVWVTSWESDDAAKEFELAGKEVLKQEWSTTTDSFVERRGKRVLLVLGAPRKRTKPIVEATLGAK